MPVFASRPNVLMSRVEASLREPTLRQGGLILAAPASGSGKTLVTAGLLRHLRGRGWRVAAAKAGPEKVVCKKTQKTGSNASFERTCMTPTEWAKQSDEAKDMWGDIQGKKGSTHGN